MAQSIKSTLFSTSQPAVCSEGVEPFFDHYDFMTDTASGTRALFDFSTDEIARTHAFLDCLSIGIAWNHGQKARFCPAATAKRRGSKTNFLPVGNLMSKPSCFFLPVGN